MYTNMHILVACSSPSVSWDLFSCSVNPVPELYCLVREALGFSVLLIWPIFGSVFQFSLQFSHWLSNFVKRLFFKYHATGIASCEL